ncbi:MAG: type IV secretory system conjugative DNA transfer family protein [Lachnospiraceae bacterium]|nr:type IV secretory system conjugative DNA transfer family protein [Lachnospiraceae bacterium]
MIRNTKKKPIDTYRNGDYTGNRILGKNCTRSNDTSKTGLNNNDLIVGVSGAGKTSSYIIPNLACANHSMVVADTKGQLCKMLRKPLV